MDQVIKMEDINWRQRCHQRMEILKTINFDQPSPQSKLCMPFELLQTVQHGDEDIFLDMLEQICTEKELPLSAIVDQVTPRGDSLLHLAVYFQKENIAELIAFHFPTLLTKQNVKGSNPLHYAALTKNSRLVKIILSQYAAEKFKPSSSNEDLELTRSTDVYGNTALHVAVGTRNVDVVAEIFHADKPVAYYANELVSSPLYAAVMCMNMEIVDCLLQESLQEDQPMCQGNSPLHAAIAQGTTKTSNPALLRALVEKKPELIYLTDENGGTALHFAADRGSVECVVILSGNYPGLTLERDAKGYLPIHVACERGHVDVVTALLQHQQHRLKDLLTPEGENVLHVAAKNGKHSMVNYLLEHKDVDINEKDNNGNTPLHLASKGLYPKILFSLIHEKGIDLQAQNNGGLTPLDVVVLQRRIPWTHRQILSFKILDFAGVMVTVEDENESSRRQREGKFATVDWIKSKADTLVLLSILITTVTFAAGFTVPGGLFSSDGEPNQRGKAVFVNKPMFQSFVILNTIAMYSSTVGTFSLFWATQLRDDNVFWSDKTYWLAFAMVGTALVSMSLAFMLAVRLVVNNVSWLANSITISGVIFLSLILIGYYVTTVDYGSLRPVTYFSIWFHVTISIDYGAEEFDKSNSQHADKERTNKS